VSKDAMSEKWIAQVIVFNLPFLIFVLSLIFILHYVLFLAVAATKAIQTNCPYWE
jgi:hypothetical protein